MSVRIEILRRKERTDAERERSYALNCENQ